MIAPIANTNVSSNYMNRVSPSYKGSKTKSIGFDNKKDNVKLLTGASIAGALLLAFIFRKNIMKLFKGKKPTEPPKPPVEPPKPPVEPEPTKFDGQKTLEEYRSIVNSQKPFPSNGSEEEKAAWNKIDERRMELRRELKTNNISIVLKKEYSLNPFEDVQSKMEYLRNLSSDSFFNMSSQLDVINEYAKYGVRTWINEGTGESFIRNLFTVCSPLESDVTDEHKKVVAEKFIEIAERTTERDNSGMRDSIKVIGIMEDYGKLFDEGLAIRYIELLKKISFQQIDEYSVNNAIAHLSEKPSIKQIMQEYHDILQEYPVEDFASSD